MIGILLRFVAIWGSTGNCIELSVFSIVFLKEIGKCKVDFDLLEESTIF